MNAFQIEAWARAAVHQVCAGNPNRDVRIAILPRWLKPKDAASRLAGHANTVHGETVLWVVGVDPKAAEIVGAEAADIDEWYRLVRAEFDEKIAPVMHPVPLVYDEKNVFAILFETDRFPYVVRTEHGNYAVPWHDERGTFTARRADLFALLSVMQLQPRTELLQGQVSLYIADKDEMHFTVFLELYLEPYGNERLVIPFHRCESILQYADGSFETPLQDIRLTAPVYGPDRPADVRTIQSAPDELLCYGPGKVRFFANSRNRYKMQAAWDSDLSITINLLPVNATAPTIITARFSKTLVSSARENVLMTWNLVGGAVNE